MSVQQPIKVTGYAGQHDESGAYIDNASGLRIASTPSIHNFGGDWQAYHEVPRRLAACWNACEGISTDDIEAVSKNTGPLLANKLAEVDALRIMATQRDELLASLEFMVANIGQPACLENREGFAAAKAAIAIAKAKGPAIAVHCGAKDAATVQERCLGDDLANAWKNGPADAGTTNLLPIVEALLAKAYKQNWNDQYPELLEQAEAAVAAAKGGAA